MKGKLIVFEGLDRAGKTTQVDLLSQNLLLDEVPFKVFKFPNKNTSTWSVIDLFNSQLIDLHPKAIHLIYSANRWEVQEDIQKYLKAGYVVICDRYLYSGTAYTCGAFNVDFTWCLQSDAGLIMPDLTFYIDTPEELRCKRLDPLNQRHEAVEIQRNVERIYSQFEGSNWIKIDGSESTEQMSQRINRYVGNLLQTHVDM